MSLGVLYSYPYYLGGSTSVEAGKQYHVALAGHPFMLDRSERFGGLRHQSVPLVRQQADNSDAVGEQTINPQGFWRRSGESWHMGAGQATFDRPGASPWRFRASKGMYVFERWQLSLLPAVDEKRTSANTNLRFAVAGDNLYLVDGTALLRTTDLDPGSPTWTAVTGTPATAASSITSDGFDVYSAHGTDGLYLTTRGAATTASHVTGNVLVAGYVKGRLMVAGGPNSKAVYNITAAGPLPTVLFDHPNTDFRWVGFAEGTNHIYAAGFSGDKSLVYRTAVKEDGTALDAMVIAGRLPDGEIITGISGYLGFILLGSNKGVRFASPDANGNLTIGALIEIGSGNVHAFEGQDRFVWFSWPAFDATDSGLGRIDLSTFSDVEALAPAYASDIMAAANLGDVLSIVTFDNRTVFTVAGQGVFASSVTQVVPEGTIDTGAITYNLLDNKLLLEVDAIFPHHVEGSKHSVDVSIDGGPFASLGEHEEHLEPFFTGDTKGHSFELRWHLKRSTIDTSMGAELRSWLLKAQPMVPATEVVIAPLLFAPIIELADGEPATMDTNAERNFIAGLCGSREIVQWQEGIESMSVIAEDFDLWKDEVYIETDGLSGFNGTLTVKLKRV